MLICHLYMFFGEVPVKVLLSIFKFGHLFYFCWILRVLDTLWIIVLYQTCLSHIFSSSLWIVFSRSLDTVSCIAENFNLIKSSLSSFSFMNCAFDILLKVIAKPKVTYIFSCFFPKNFTVYCFTFRYVIHFELIFVRGVKPMSIFIFFCMWLFFCSSIICWKGYLFFIMLPIVKDQLATCMCMYLWALHSVPSICLFILSPVPYCFDYDSFILHLTLGGVSV